MNAILKAFFYYTIYLQEQQGKPLSSLVTPKIISDLKIHALIPNCPKKHDLISFERFYCKIAIYLEAKSIIPLIFTIKDSIQKVNNCI